MSEGSHPVGRPSMYTDELATEICKTISTSADSLKKLCEARPHWPLRQTIYEWYLNKPQFSVMFAKAKQMQCDVRAEDLIDIADESQDAALGGLRISTRKWYVSKLAPRLWGDKVMIVDESGNEEIVRTTRKKLDKALDIRKKDY